ncbi:MAG: peptidoglycan DD-metalloendopeptidase family protein [Candidatus Eremiobacterota bacterium]
MKIFITLFFVMLLAGILQAQEVTEIKPDQFQDVMNEFVNRYNDREYDKMVAGFSPEMLEELPLEKTADLFGEMFTNYGEILKVEPPVFKEGNQAIFGVRCDRGILNINLVITKDNKIFAMQIMPYTPDIPVPERNSVELSLPFKGEWFVLWGGDTKALNRYNSDPTMRFCFDFIVIDGNKKTHKDIGEKNEDYYAYGQEVFSPADGTVTDVIDGVRDNIPGINNPYSKLGNAVYIQHSDYEVSILAHLKPGSIKVRPGDKVKRGDPVGLCGNSGDSILPHIQYNLQNSSVMQYGTGIKCYFKKLMIKKSGDMEEKLDYSPTQGDTVSPE